MARKSPSWTSRSTSRRASTSRRPEPVHLADAAHLDEGRRLSRSAGRRGGAVTASPPGVAAPEVPPPGPVGNCWTRSFADTVPVTTWVPASSPLRISASSAVRRPTSTGTVRASPGPVGTCDGVGAGLTAQCRGGHRDDPLGERGGDVDVGGHAGCDARGRRGQLDHHVVGDDAAHARGRGREVQRLDRARDVRVQRGHGDVGGLADREPRQVALGDRGGDLDGGRPQPDHRPRCEVARPDVNGGDDAVDGRRDGREVERVLRVAHGALGLDHGPGRPRPPPWCRHRWRPCRRDSADRTPSFAAATWLAAWLFVLVAWQPDTRKRAGRLGDGGLVRRDHGRRERRPCVSRGERPLRVLERRGCLRDRQAARGLRLRGGVRAWLSCCLAWVTPSLALALLFPVTGFSSAARRALAAARLAVAMASAWSASEVSAVASTSPALTASPTATLTRLDRPGAGTR